MSEFVSTKRVRANVSNQLPRPPPDASFPPKPMPSHHNGPPFTSNGCTAYNDDAGQTSPSFSVASYSLPPNGVSAPPGKMLLPPLRPAHSAAANATSKAVDRNRTSHACDKCRRAKAKCTGGLPCEKCKNESKHCVYGDGKRDKEKKELERVLRISKSVRQRNEELLQALQKMSIDPQLDRGKRDEIEDLISKTKVAELCVARKARFG